METLVTSLDPPVCTNIDATSDETLQLSGTTTHVVLSGDGTTSRHSKKNSKIRVDLDTLSVLRGPRLETTVRLFPKPQQHPRPQTSEDPLVLQLQKIRRLRERLQKKVQETVVHRNDDEDSPLVVFRRNCHAIFDELRSALAGHQAAAVTAKGKKEPTSVHVVTSTYAKQVTHQLAALEKTFGRSVVRELSKDCRTVTLQYEDNGERQHILAFDLISTATTLSDYQSIVDQYFPFEHRNGDDNQEDVKPSASKKRRTRPNHDEEDSTLLTSYLEQEFRRFCTKIDSYQPLYEELAALDANGQVLDEMVSPWTVHYRRLHVTDQVSVVVTLHTVQPRQQPPTNLQWVGRGREAFTSQFDVSRWKPDRSVLDNLDECCGATLPRRVPSDDGINASNEAGSRDCAICYSQELLVVNTDGTEAGEAGRRPRIQCETCQRLFHGVCLRKWLDSLLTSRISFDMVIGNCPYCKQPITAPMR